MPLRVDERSAEAAEASEDWFRVDSLLGGTRAMRAAGEELLPRWPAETTQSYEARLRVTVLFPAFRRTLGVMVGKPFSKELTLSDDTPPLIREWCDDIDMNGHNLHAFMSETLREALAYGFSGVMIDYSAGPPAKTVAAEIASGRRPYFVRVKHDQILGWKTAVVNGSMKLSQLRIAEAREIPDGPYGNKLEEQTRVLEPGRWEIWRKNDKGELFLAEHGTNSLNEIPFVPFYGSKLGFMVGESPLLDLAYLNIKHWQDSSDQDKTVRFARVRIAAIIGVDDLTSVTLGGDYLMKLPIGADIKIAQGSAESVNVGRSELSALEEQMVQTGAELLVQKPGQRTATEANNDAEANRSDLQRIVEGFEDSLDMALYLLGAWVGITDTGNATIFKDFGALTLSDASLILPAQQGGILSKETALREYQRHGAFSPDIDPEEEQARIEAEGPALGEMIPANALPPTDGNTAPPPRAVENGNVEPE